MIVQSDFADFEQTKNTYYNLRSIAWNVIGWGGITSLFSGLLLGTLTHWKLFRHRLVTFKFLTVVGLVLFGMFFLEDLMLTNLDLLLNKKTNALSDSAFRHNHYLIEVGLLIEAFVFISLIAISILKPRFKKS